MEGEELHVEVVMEDQTSHVEEMKGVEAVNVATVQEGERWWRREWRR